MILDSRNEFAINATLALGTLGSYNIANSIDLGPNGCSASELAMVIRATQAIAASATGMLTLQLVAASDPAFTTPKVLLQRTFATGTTPIPAGTRMFDVELPAVPAQYVGLRQVITGAVLTSGGIAAALTPVSNGWAAHDAPRQL